MQRLNIHDANYYYDSLGNRTAVTDGQNITYQSNKLNQHASVAATPYSYDSKGNLTNDGQYKYYYDCENRLTDVNTVANAKVAKYDYDYLGRRTQKTVFSTQNTTKFCYDGGQIIAEYNGSGLIKRENKQRLRKRNSKLITYAKMLLNYPSNSL